MPVKGRQALQSCNGFLKYKKRKIYLKKFSLITIKLTDHWVVQMVEEVLGQYQLFDKENNRMEKVL